MFGKSKKEVDPQEVQKRADEKMRLLLAEKNGDTSVNELTKRELFAAEISKGIPANEFDSRKEWADEVVSLANALLDRLQK